MASASGFEQQQAAQGAAPAPGCGPSQQAGAHPGAGAGAQALFAFGPGFREPLRTPLPPPPPSHAASSAASSSTLVGASLNLKTSVPILPPPQQWTAQPEAPVEPLGHSLQRDDHMPPGWERHVHFDGTTYHRHANMHMLTPDDVSASAPDLVRALERLRTVTVASLRAHNLLHDLPRDVEIVAERMNPEVPTVFYFVSVGAGCVINYVDACACVSPSHTEAECVCPKLGLEVAPKRRFWEHLAAYPMHLTALPRDAEADFLTALTHGANERILDERKSMFPYTDEQARRFMQVYRDLKSVPYSQGRASVLPALAWHIARVLAPIADVRARYHHGTPRARLYRDIAVPPPSRGERACDALLFCVLLGTHRAYRARLAGARPRGRVYVPDFREVVRGMLVEWTDSNLLATVFVSANVAFLAVPEVSALQRTASLASTLFSMLSIVLGVHHVWRHRRHADADEDAATRYLRPRLPYTSSLTPLACLLALPLAALLWAAAAFTLAVASYSLSPSTGGVHARALLGALLGALLLLALLAAGVFWGAWRGPVSEEPEEAYKQRPVGRKLHKVGWAVRVRRAVRRGREGVERARADVWAWLSARAVRAGSGKAGSEGSAAGAEPGRERAGAADTHV